MASEKFVGKLIAALFLFDMFPYVCLFLTKAEFSMSNRILLTTLPILALLVMLFGKIYLKASISLATVLFSMVLTFWYLALPFFPSQSLETALFNTAWITHLKFYFYSRDLYSNLINK
jgi:hypothetical protein